MEPTLTPITDVNPRDLIQQLADAYAYCIDEYMSAPSEQDALINEARAYLAQPELDAPSLKEQALEALAHILNNSSTELGADTIRRALEQLND